MLFFYFLKFSDFQNYRKRNWIFPPLPGLVIVPFFTYLSFKLFNFNLIFPIHFFASNGEILIHVFISSILLGISSGLFRDGFYSLQEEIKNWSSKPFLITAMAYSKSPLTHIVLIVLPKSFLETLNRSLVWIFAELMIIEAMLNAPGLALRLWNLTKNQEILKFFKVASLLLLLFLSINRISAAFRRKLGKRLAGYA